MHSSREQQQLGALHVALAGRCLGEMTCYFHVSPCSVKFIVSRVMAVYRPLVRASMASPARLRRRRCRPAAWDAFVVPPTVTPQPTVRGVLRELGPPNGRDGHDQG